MLVKLRLVYDWIGLVRLGTVMLGSVSLGLVSPSLVSLGYF